MYSQVFLLLTHSHVHSLQFSPKLFPMEFSLVKARLAKENKMGKKTKQKQQGRESRWLKSKGSDHFKPKATCTYMCTLIPADASIVSVSHLHCSLSSGLHCTSKFCLLHMSMCKKLIFWIRNRKQHMWFSLYEQCFGQFGAYKTDSDQKTAPLWLKASKRHFQHNFWWHKWVMFLKECIQTVFRAFNKHRRPTKCIATLLREVGYFFSRKNWEATSLNNIVYKKGSS